MRAIDAMIHEFLEHTREHFSAFSQSIANPSKNTCWSSAFLAAERPCRARGMHTLHTTGLGACWRLGSPETTLQARNFWRVDARHFDRSKRLRALLEDNHPHTGAL